MLRGFSMSACVVGCDPSSKKLAFTVSKDGGYTNHVYDIRVGQKYTPQTAAMTKRAVAELLDLIGTIGSGEMFIESPLVGRGGVRSSVVQAFVNGIVQAEFTSAGWDVHIVPVQTWKKHVVGSGRATKEDIADWARVHDKKTWKTKDQDVMDSLGLCVYGEQIMKRAESIGE